MKKVVYRDLLGDNPLKHELSMEEVLNQDNFKITKKRISKYFVRDKYFSGNVRELKRWIIEEKNKTVKRDFHILRKLDTSTGENKIVCKVIGEMYVIHGKTAYKLIYFNEIKVQIRYCTADNRRMENKDDKSA